ncbi:MAG: Lrp/AsnC family transcriptional regulator [Flavobacteriaceae bacterium]|nr:transcriptional regulator [Flavobacteriaceae bacterium]MAW16125.1 transcriptional regulator [Flavobacteriaceae bacterium]MAW16255.1 transcriptional regulator [Flavobacteriaceae bacterium]MBJ33814.1 transcriptional regulator [Flavobacteriaceae bacterium]
MKKEDNQFSLDGIDKAILRVLMENARTPVQEIARQLDLSGTAVHQRLKKLEDANLISGSYLKLNPASLGYSTTAYIGVYLDKAMRNPEAVAQLKKIKEVVECHYTTGNWSILIKILCKNNEHLMQVLNHEIQSIEGVSRTETFISLHQQIDRQISI